MGSIRAFVAFDTPEAIRPAMSSVQSELRKAEADVSWEPPEKFHATIKFLGNVSEPLLGSVLAKIQQSAAYSVSFEVSYRTLGCFPDQKNPRVVWIGCENSDGGLDLLKTALDVELLGLGFDVDKREFHPHVTLGRVKSPRGAKNLTPLLKSLTFEPRTAVITEILLMKSVLKARGSEYTALHQFQLKPRPGVS